MEIIKQVFKNHSFTKTYEGLRNSPPSKEASIMRFNGKATDLPHNFIILIDKSSYPWDLLEFKFSIIVKYHLHLCLEKKVSYQFSIEALVNC